MKGGSKVVVQPHRHDGVFVAKGKEDALCTKNMVVGESVYGEKRISVQVMIRSNGLLFMCFSSWNLNKGLEGFSLWDSMLVLVI